MTSDRTVRQWSVLIADDEPAARRGVQQLLAPYPDFTVVGECRHGGELLGSLERRRVDLVFLDIQMPGVDGFEAIRRQTPDRMPTVVFLTAYDQYALQAYEVHAFDYLVKPVAQARFAQTIRRLRRLAASDPVPQRDTIVLVPSARGAVVVSLFDVDWIEAADNYSRLWVRNRSHLVRESLSALEVRARPLGFRRAHRSALVRLDTIASINMNGGTDATLSLQSGAEVPLARRRRAAFVRALRTAHRTE